MKNDKITQIRSSLMQKKEILQMSANLTAHQLKTGDAVCADPFDHAAVEMYKAVELNCRQKEWHQLLDIQDTLLRMEYGFFGVCDHCGRKISAKRLDALPMTKYCVTCQTEIESHKNNSEHRVRNSGKVSCNYA